MPHLIVRAIWELARARLILGRTGAKDIKRLNQAARSGTDIAIQSAVDSALIARIGFVIAFASRYVPWRSDCLPQAMAGQSWLLADGIASEIRIGVERPRDGPFGAHAWLVQGEQIVTGGEIERFAVLLGEEPNQGVSPQPAPTPKE